MKACLTALFLSAVCSLSQALAEETTEADRKLLAEIRTKAEKGDAQSQYRLGAAYYFPLHGLAKDDALVVKWCRKAAEQNHAKAQYNLGNCYAEGQGVPKDEVEAVKWYRKAAEQNDAFAQTALGFAFERGKGVATDPSEAVQWYRKAANQHHAKAQYNLGVFYLAGVGVAKDEPEAVNWFRKSAEQNDVEAQYNLGMCFLSGSGVVKDEMEAYKWWLLAAAQGNELARKGLPVLEGGILTRDQRAEGQKLARDFKPRQPQQQGRQFSPNDVDESRPHISGTGFFISEDGYFITNQHVASEGATVRVLTASGTLPAKVVKVDKANDLALLKAEGKFTALPVITSRGVRLGATAATVGFPNTGLQGYSPKLARGEIASLAGAQDDARHFQISAPLQPGNSGGALVDERGNVIGVVVAKLSQRAARTPLTPALSPPPRKGEGVKPSGARAEKVNCALKAAIA